MKLFRKRLKLIVSILSPVLIFQILFLNNMDAFAMVTIPTVTYTVTGNTTVGSTIDIAVNVSNAIDLYGGSVDFVYDTTLLQVQSVTKGNIFGSSNTLTPIGANGKIQNGQATFAIILQGNINGVSNNGTLAIIKAKILKVGTVNLKTTNTNSTLSLTGFTTRVKLSDSYANSISYTATDKSISLTSNTPLIFDSLTTSKVSPKLPNENTNIKITANAIGSGTIQYEFWIKNGLNWSLVRDYSTSPTYIWTPISVGNYTIRVYAKDSMGTSISKDLIYTISKPLKSNNYNLRGH